MTEKWSDELPDDAFLSQAEKTYMHALAKIREGLAKGFDFVSASASVNIDDPSLKQIVLDDVLKVIIAEDHFIRQIPLEEISRKLTMPIDRLEKARAEMLEDVEETTIKAMEKISKKEQNTNH
ncbi:MAG: hypothetical protein HZB62_16100 [Nitrospirae bacterium]|nr:hypothetical protein [Nitrospirota bacterium]